MAESVLIAAIFDRFTAGDSLRGIAAWLAGQSLTARNGNDWNPSTIRTILLNPRYAGRAVYRGEPTGKLGEWEPIISEVTFDSAQAILADPRRKTNRTGTDRKYLGSGVYRCGVCEHPMRSHSGGRYRCPAGGHMVRSITQVDEYVELGMRTWLSRSDLADLLETPDSPESQAHSKDVTRLRKLIEKFEVDYDAGFIEGKRFAVATEKAHAELRRAEQARTRATASTALSGLMRTKDPAAAFMAAPLGTQRAIVDEYWTVTLHAAPRGRKAFDPKSVDIEWKARS